MHRILLLTVFVLSIVLAPPAVGPQERQKFKCSGPVVTRDRAGPGNEGRAWTSEGSDTDGILSFTHCEYFKAGTTTITKSDPKKLTSLPAELAELNAYMKPHGLGIRVGALPPGVKLYRDLVFEVRTTAISTGPHPVAFSIPSASEDEFKNLWVFYLDEDDMDPGSLVWQGRPYPELDIPKPDLKRRTFTAGVEFVSVFHRRARVGRFVVATIDREQYERSPAADLEITSFEAPPSAKVGETFSFTVMIGNRGPAPATDIVFNNILGGHEEFVSAAASQGLCRKSVNTDSVTVCRLGTIAPGGSVRVTIAVKVGNDLMIGYHGSVKFQTMNTVRAQERDPSHANNYLETKSTTLSR